MKSISMLLAGLASLAGAESSLASSAPPSLRSSAVRTRVCEAIATESKGSGITTKECLRDGEFRVIREVKTTIRQKSVSTKLVVRAEIESATFEVSVSRGVHINDAGEIELNATWDKGELILEKLGDSQLVSSALTSAKNVKQADTHRGIPIAVLGWTNYAHAPDYKLISMSYYRVYRSETLDDVLGYIAIEDSCSSEIGECITSTARFDLEGDQIGEIDEESRGINE